MSNYLIAGEINNSGRLWVVNSQTLNIVKTLTVSDDDDLNGIAYDPVRDRYIIANRFGIIYEYTLAGDTLTRVVISSSITGYTFQGLAYDSVRPRVLLSYSKTGGRDGIREYTPGSYNRPLLESDFNLRASIDAPFAITYVPVSSPRVIVFNNEVLDEVVQFAPGSYTSQSPTSTTLTTAINPTGATYDTDLSKTVFMTSGSAAKLHFFTHGSYAAPTSVSDLPAALRAAGVVLRGIAFQFVATTGFNHVRGGVKYNKVIRGGTTYNKAIRGGITY